MVNEDAVRRVMKDVAHGRLVVVLVFIDTFLGFTAEWETKEHSLLLVKKLILTESLQVTVGSSDLVFSKFSKEGKFELSSGTDLTVCSQVLPGWMGKV